MSSAQSQTGVCNFWVDVGICCAAVATPPASRD